MRRPFGCAQGKQPAQRKNTHYYLNEVGLVKCFVAMARIASGREPRSPRLGKVLELPGAFDSRRRARYYEFTRLKSGYVVAESGEILEAIDEEC
jgi:hypothetical protein